LNPSTGGPAARRLENFHPDDQSINEPVAVEHVGIGDQIAGARVVYHLMTSTVMLPSGSSVKPLGSTSLEIAANCRFQ
jgi:hypothetical protein